MKYAEVSVNSPVAQRRAFSYAIPENLDVREGQAVLVGSEDQLADNAVDARVDAGPDGRVPRRGLGVGMAVEPLGVPAAVADQAPEAARPGKARPRKLPSEHWQRALVDNSTNAEWIQGKQVRASYPPPLPIFSCCLTRATPFAASSSVMCMS